MRQSMISKAEINQYMIDIKQQLKHTHSREQVKDITEMLKKSIDEYIEENPSATMDDFKEHFDDINDFRDMVFSDIDTKMLEKKLNNVLVIKKVVALTLILVVIVLSINVGLCVKTYIDAQDAIANYKVIEILN